VAKGMLKRPLEEKRRKEKEMINTIHSNNIYRLLK
jgi:hypothetical protein